MQGFTRPDVRYPITSVCNLAMTLKWVENWFATTGTMLPSSIGQMYTETQIKTATMKLLLILCTL